MSATIVITGANRGIGLALTKQYQAAGEQVLGICRHSSPALEQTGARVVSGVDITAPDAADSISAALNGQNIDILIHNAGILTRETLADCPPDRLARQFQVNAMAPLLLTSGLQANLARPGKIAFITSRMGSIADNTSGSRYGYRMSKAALNAAAKSVAVDLAPAEIAVAILHPGFVQTDMVEGRGHISAAEAATRLRARIAELTLANSGTFWHSDGSELPW